MINDIARKVAQYAYAFNQSRARVVLAPMYSLAAGALLYRAPLPTATLEREVPDDLFTPYRERSRKLQYWVEDLDFSKARPELLTDRQRFMIQQSALGESSFAAVASFLNVYHAIPELATFFPHWTTEELNHYLGFHRYLEAMGESWSATKLNAVAGVEFIPYSEDPYEIAACNLYQELISLLFYRSLAKQVGDPFLRDMLMQFAKDETRHYVFYEAVVVRHMKTKPEFRRVILKTFLRMITPLPQNSDSVEETLSGMRNGMYYIRKHEFDYLNSKLNALVGKDVSGAIKWFLDGVNPPCAVCSHKTYDCECESYELAEQARELPIAAE